MGGDYSVYNATASDIYFKENLGNWKAIRSGKSLRQRCPGVFNGKA
jgi:hypothetical protein